MTNRNTEVDKYPTPDPAEDNAFFPSAYSLEKYTSSKSDLEGANYPNPYREGKWKVLMIASDERYLLMQNGTMFSTENRPVEMLPPMYHMNKTGFEFNITTLSGNPAKLEPWTLDSLNARHGRTTFDVEILHQDEPLEEVEQVLQSIGGSNNIPAAWE